MNPEQKEVRLIAVRGLPEVKKGDKLAFLLMQSADFEAGDVVVLAQKVVSKAEGRVVRLADVEVSESARRLGRETEKDERLVQLILDESRDVLRSRRGLIIVEDRRGWVCANAGIDRSNVVQESGETVCLLPVDPDSSAAAIQAELTAATGVDLGVVISDSHGRAWREGTVGVAIGAANVETVSDRRGQPDRYGYTLQHTVVGRADELAAAASLLMGQGDESVPCVIIRGLEALGSGTARDLQRRHELDLFR